MSPTSAPPPNPPSSSEDVERRLLDKMIELEKMEEQGTPSPQSMNASKQFKKNPKKKIEVVDQRTADLVLMKPSERGRVGNVFYQAAHQVSHWLSSWIWNAVSGDVYEAQQREQRAMEKNRLRQLRLEKNQSQSPSPASKSAEPTHPKKGS